MFSLQSLVVDMILTVLIPGKSSKDPSTGTRLMKPTATGKNPLWKRRRQKHFTCIHECDNKELIFLMFELTWIRGRNRRSPEPLQWSASQSEPQTLLPGRNWWLSFYVSGRKIWRYAPGRWQTTDRRQTESVWQAETQKTSQVWHLSEDEREMFDWVVDADQLTFPMARSALSKNSIIPKKRKKTPNPVSPIPISVDFKSSRGYITCCHTLLVKYRITEQGQTHTEKLTLTDSRTNIVKMWIIQIKSSYNLQNKN